MAEDGEFKIKGAAKVPASPSQESIEYDNQPAHAAEKTLDAATEAEEAQGGEEDGEIPETEEELKGKYKWFKCQADPAVYGPSTYYYIHQVTEESKWTEPDEPYWLYDQETGSADPVGLQYPEKTKPVEVYTGYNPKIHGNYDPNADYAQYHNQKRAEEAAAAEAANLGRMVTHEANLYESTVALNRFTGSAQGAGINPERHSDAAKSKRQMSAFFDVDAAANAHEGRSLKEERKQKKLTKEEVEAYKKSRHEKKNKRRLAFYKS